MCKESTPILTWREPTTNLTFEWDGQAPVISVSNGEEFRIEGTVGVRNASIARWMKWFELVCFNYIRLQVTS